MKLNKEMINQFYQKAKSKSNNATLSSYPFFLLFLGKTEEALNEFLKAKDYNQYSITLIHKATDFKFVEQRLDVLIKNAPQKAIDVLSCDQISSEKSIDLVKKKYPTYLTPVLRKLIDHKDIVDREEIANFYITQMINLIKLINESETNIEKLKKSVDSFNEMENKFKSILSEHSIPEPDMVELLKTQQEVNDYLDDVDAISKNESKITHLHVYNKNALLAYLNGINEPEIVLFYSDDDREARIEYTKSSIWEFYYYRKGFETKIKDFCLDGVINNEYFVK